MLFLFLFTAGKQLSCQRKDQSVPESCQEPPPIDQSVPESCQGPPPIDGTRQINSNKPALSCFVFKCLKKGTSLHAKTV